MSENTWFSILGTVPMGWRSTWPGLHLTHPWALTRLLGPVTSLGSSLNARHSPWASGQQDKVPGP